ncbi:MAG TPA: amino acid adenylation domain-containing protein [Kofleriaceae bacterium]|nr:amino acid adenylation domain-containing protein [Kofleriaceae bacterium]
MTTPADTNELSLVKRSLLALQDMQARLDESERQRTEPIAVVGLGCRLPGGARDPAAFWRLLEAGGDAISQVPADRWDVDAYFHPEPATPGKMSSRWGGFLDDPIDGFDAGFFGISPREAVRMDPQQRLLLEVAWEALEDAGQTRERLAGSRTGVFAGICTTDYSSLQFTDPEDIDAYTGTGNSLSILAGRLAYLLDLQGPSVALDTACSSSLVAVHLACQSLRAGDCRLALAGGVNLMLSPRTAILASQMRMLAADGRCKTFDAHADGFVRGEGCGVVVLKRLSDAMADGDTIHALIRSSAVNGDGKTNGLTAPNGRSQQAVIREALARAHVEPGEISYVEAHGTGTSLGDPIEMEALAAAIGEPAPDRPTCSVGSVKTNIGHLEAAAGIAGLLKVVLSLEHEAIPPILHFQTLNPNISLDGTRFALPTELTPWQRNGKRRVAGMSSFGWSGTNAHVVIEEPPAVTPAPAAEAGPDEVLVLPISAHSPEALRALAEAYRDRLCEPGVPPLRDLCFSAAVRRTHHDHRLAIVGQSHAELADGLAAFLAGGPRSNVAAGALATPAPHRLVFVFPGQGGQWPGMAQDLLAREPVFADAIAACDAALRRHVDWSLRELLAASPAPPLLDRIDVMQPALFALQVAFAALWRSLGIVPQAVVGHSMGEIAAAHIAGALSLDDAACVIARRSRLLRTISGRGAMAVVELPLAEAQRALARREDRLAIAASNGPTTTVVSGDPAALAALLDELTRREVFCRPVNVDVASHSPQVDALRPELHAALAGLAPRSAVIPFHSTVTGALADGRELDATYWESNLRRPVLFAPVIDRLVAQGHDLFIELSPHPVLGGSLQQILRGRGDGGAVLASMRRDRPGRDGVLAALGALYVQGHPVDWSRLYTPPGRVVSLPSYPWQRERFWHTPKATAPVVMDRRDPATHPLLGTPVVLAHAPRDRVWQAVVDLKRLSYIDDHRVQGLAVLPGAGYVEMAMAAAAQAFGAQKRVLSAFEFRRLLFFPEDGARIVQTSVTVGGDRVATFQVHSRPAEAPDTPWTLHATAQIDATDAAQLADPSGPADATSDAAPTSGVASIAAIQDRCLTTTSAAEFYREYAEHGNHWGPRFQGITALWRGPREALGELRVPAALISELGRYRVHPAVLDACFQVLGATIPVGAIGSAQSFVPTHLERVVVHGPARGSRLWSHARSAAEVAPGGASFCGDVRIFDEDGTVLVEIFGLRGRGLDREAMTTPVKLEWFHELRWPAKPLAATPSSGPGRWLVLADQQGVGAALAERLRSEGEQAICVRAGASFARLSEASYTVRPTADAAPEDVAHLIEVMRERGAPPWRGVIHLWSLDAAAEPASAAQLSEAQDPTCGFVSPLLHALSAVPTPPRLWLVTRGAQAAIPSDGPVVLAQAPLWGLGRTIPLEHPALWGALVDLDPHTSAEDSAAQLAGEIVHGDREDQIAYRGSTRHVARLAASPLGQDPAHAARIEIACDASYLVTGGLGGLGLAVAQRLVERGARHLVLIGRIGLPDRAQRSDVAADTPLARTIAAVGRLEAQGATVHVVALDVADEQVLTARLAALHAAGLPPIRGVIHAAGVAELVPLQDLAPATLSSVLRPKVQGGYALHRALASEPLDFFVLYSSMASLLSSPLLGAYSAANAFLDALAQHRRAQGQPAISIGWGYWEQIGMGARIQTSRGRDGAAEGMGSFAPEEGLAAFERVLVANPVHIGVMPIDWARWQKAHGEAARLPVLADVCSRPAGAAPARRTATLDLDALLAAPAEDQANQLASYLRRELARVLRLPEARIDVAQPLNRLGIDSLMAVELKNGIEADLGVTVPVVRFLQGPSVTQLAEQLTGLLAARAARSDATAAAPDPALPILVAAPGARCEPFPLNDIQQAYWVGRNGYFELGSVAAHMYVEVDGTDLDIGRLQDAWQKLVIRHDMLRAVILPDGRQQVQAAVPSYVIEVDDLRGADADRAAARLEATRRRLSHQVMATDRWPLFEIRASRLDDRRVRIHLSFDILIADIWSWQILFHEWAALYGDPATALVPLEITFRDYVLAERTLEDTEAHQRSLAYWRDRIPALPPAPDLPLSSGADARAEIRFDRRTAAVPAEAWRRLKARAHDAGLTPSGLLLAAFSEVLATWSKSPRFTLNVTLFNRLPLHPQVNHIVGDFTSVNLLAVDAAAGDSFEARAQGIQRRLWEDLEHRRVSGVHVLRELARAQSSAPRALMPIVFTSTLGASYADGDGFPIEWLGEIGYSISQTPQVWIDHQVFERHGALVFNWDFVDGIFPPGQLDAMFEAYRALLGRLADQPRSWTEAERRLLPPHDLAVQAAANATDAPVPAGLLHTLFEEQAERTPDAVAVIAEDRTLTYRELRARGARPEQLVAVVMDKGWEQVVAVLAVLQAGAAYVPISPAVPRERLAYLLEHSEVELVVTQPSVDPRVEWPEGTARLCVTEREPEAGERLQPVQTAEDLAYVIYTSGSTGLPKGVMIEHRAAVNTIVDMNTRFGVGPGDRVLALSSLTFDLSVYDIFGALGAGAAIVMPPPSATRDPARWSELMVRTGVTIWDSVPTLMQALVDYADGDAARIPASLRLVLMSGDWIPVGLPDRIRALVDGVEVYSLGGATEAAIWSILYPIGTVDPGWKSIPYGKPMVNQRFHVLNELFEPCPIGVAGPLCIAGVGLARGYWRDPEKTAKSFFVHPRTGERLYRTGDLGRYLPDGNLEFLGREDFQVKVNGFRVELGEIEAALEQHPAVARTVAAAVGEVTARRLVGYVVPRPGASLGASELREFLLTKLPAYMVPGSFVIVAALPLSANGKVDRAALAALDAAPVAAPRDTSRPSAAQPPMVARLARLITRVLQVETLDPEANLLDLGVSSLEMIRIANLMQQELGTRPQIDEFYRYPTLEGLAQWYAEADLAEHEHAS